MEMRPAIVHIDGTQAVLVNNFANEEQLERLRIRKWTKRLSHGGSVHWS
jgi:hypothetical protein